LLLPLFYSPADHRSLHSFPTRRSSDLLLLELGYEKLVVCHLNHRLRGSASRTDARFVEKVARNLGLDCEIGSAGVGALAKRSKRSEEHTSELQSRGHLVCRLLLEKKKI